jgi:hypothetical protein
MDEEYRLRMGLPLPAAAMRLDMRPGVIAEAR